MNTNNDKGATNVANDTPAALLPEIGEYVLATKYSDGDPGDPWALGFYAGVTERGRHLVKDSNGDQIRAGGFRRVGRIEQEVGTWLWNNRVALESSPPGTVNLWALVKRDEPDSTAPVASESRGSVPEGWVLVPRKATQEMLRAGYYAPINHSALNGQSNNAVRMKLEISPIWSRMIGAAPTPPGNEALREVRERAKEIALARSAAAKGEG